MQLAAIEARLKLKRLQAKRVKAGLQDEIKDNDVRRRELSPPADTISRFEATDRVQSRVKQKSARSKSTTRLEVPVSPERRSQPVRESRSPGRVVLGIDKGLTGKNVSLRKAPSMRTQTPLQADERTIYPQTTRPKTFNERMAESRGEDKENNARKERIERLRRQRSTGFGVQREELDKYKREFAKGEAPQLVHNASSREEKGFSREEILRTASRAPSGLVHRKETLSGANNSSRYSSARSATKVAAQQSSSRSKSSLSSHFSNAHAFRSPPPTSSPDPFLDTAKEPPSASLFDPISSTHLSRRNLPEAVVSRLLDSKNPQLIPDLLRTIKSPDYELPNSLIESDFVVFGIIASKSSPKSHKGYHHTKSTADLTSTAEAEAADRNERGNYIVFTLTDLKWTIDLFLFGMAYTRFWKLTPGTLIAILNPTILPPKHGQEDTGKFSLALNSGDETVLEVGVSKDLGWCDAKRRDGKECGGWVDKRKAAFCEWHIEAKVERGKRGRMEVNSATSGSSRGIWGGGRGGSRGGEKGDGLKKEGPQWDRETQSKYYIAPGPAGGIKRGDSEHPGLSRGIFGLDADEDLERGGGKEERTRRRLAKLEKERDVAKKLGEGGKGTGAEYLRLRNERSKGNCLSSGNKEPSSVQPDASAEVDAGQLGLLGNKAKVIHLSPLKRKYRALGGDDEGSAWKKTRFVTPKGIRVAGRESLGMNADAKGEDEDEEDDDLDIIMDVI